MNLYCVHRVLHSYILFSVDLFLHINYDLITYTYFIIKSLHSFWICCLTSSFHSNTIIHGNTVWCLSKHQHMEQIFLAKANRCPRVRPYSSENVTVLWCVYSVSHPQLRHCLCSLDLITFLQKGSAIILRKGTVHIFLQNDHVCGLFSQPEYFVCLTESAAVSSEHHPVYVSVHFFGTWVA